MENNERKKDFCCRNCGSKSYSPVYREYHGLGALLDRKLRRIDIVFGDRAPIIGYKCDGCSVRFDDSEKFSLPPEGRKDNAKMHQKK
jgi:hypothetical protein